VHAPSEGKRDDSKGSFYEELEQVFFYHFPKYHMKILLGDFNANVGRENIFTPTIGNESLQHDSNDNGARIVNFVTTKVYLFGTRCSCTETFISTPGHILRGRLTTGLITY
jgi:hypothetical protein